MRAIDLMASLLGLLLLSPLLILIAVLIKLTSVGPVFFRASRVGEDGKIFQLLKFRTMIVDADRSGPKITATGDPRITPLGCFLRRIKLDEFPQLINVLKGEMSLVGPRPEDPAYVALYTPEQRRILQFRPGITSPATLAYRHEQQMLSDPDWERIYSTQVLPDKLSIDLSYFSRRTLLSDLLLIVRTLLSLFR